MMIVTPKGTDETLGGTEEILFSEGKRKSGRTVGVKGPSGNPHQMHGAMLPNHTERSHRAVHTLL